MTFGHVTSLNKFRGHWSWSMQGLKYQTFLVAYFTSPYNVALMPHGHRMCAAVPGITSVQSRTRGMGWHKPNCFFFFFTEKAKYSWGSLADFSWYLTDKTADIHGYTWLQGSWRASLSWLVLACGSPRHVSAWAASPISVNLVDMQSLGL